MSAADVSSDVEEMVAWAKRGYSATCPCSVCIGKRYVLALAARAAGRETEPPESWRRAYDRQQEWMRTAKDERRRSDDLQAELDGTRQALDRETSALYSEIERYREALAGRENVIEAARARVAYGHNDTCGAELGDYDCTCGHAALRAALDEAGEGA